MDGKEGVQVGSTITALQTSKGLKLQFLLDAFECTVYSPIGSESWYRLCDLDEEALVCRFDYGRGTIRKANGFMEFTMKFENGQMEMRHRVPADVVCEPLRRALLYALVPDAEENGGALAAGIFFLIWPTESIKETWPCRASRKNAPNTS
jgi:hypothetical protein